MGIASKRVETIFHYIIYDQLQIVNNILSFMINLAKVKVCVVI